jgi:hypothetical protein
MATVRTAASQKGTVVAVDGALSKAPSDSEVFGWKRNIETALTTCRWINRLAGSSVNYTSLDGYFDRV